MKWNDAVCYSSVRVENTKFGVIHAKIEVANPNFGAQHKKIGLTNRNIGPITPFFVAKNPNKAINNPNGAINNPNREVEYLNLSDIFMKSYLHYKFVTILSPLAHRFDERL